MSFNAAFVCCLALTLCLAVTGCISGRETGFDVTKELAPGMSRQEVQSVLAHDGTLSSPVTFVRNVKDVFTVKGPGDDFLVEIAVRYLHKREKADGKRVQKIVARYHGDCDAFGGYYVLYLFYDEEEKLVDHGEAHYEVR